MERERRREIEVSWNEARQMRAIQTGVSACEGSSIDGWHKGDGEREEVKREFGNTEKETEIQKKKKN